MIKYPLIKMTELNVVIELQTQVPGLTNFNW